MRQLLLHTIILFLSIFEVSGQHKSNQYQIKGVKGADDNCIHKSKYTITQRLRHYPFNRSDKVILASFRYHDKNYPIKNGKVIYDSLIEHKILSKQEVIELTDVIYNNVYKKFSGVGSITMCFFPRNAIIFIDKNGNAVETIWICFQCSRYESYSDRFGLLANNCEQKLDLIKKFFVKQRLDYGTDGNRTNYPGETGGEEGIVYPPSNTKSR